MELTATVKTPDCRISGIVRDNVETFLGIPYASSARWKDSVLLPIAQLGSYFDASKFGPSPRQPIAQTSEFQAAYNQASSQESEVGELNLNIYRPLNVDESVKLPVLIHLHQGDFFSGCNSMRAADPSNFVAKYPVIFVVPNVRQGFLGWASHPQLGGGLYGLKDAANAVRWVRENISHFNGDLSNIILFGHSAGAVLAEHLGGMSEFDNVISKIILASPYVLPPKTLEQYQQEFVLYARSVVPESENLSETDIITALKAIEKPPFELKFRRLWGPYGLPTPSTPTCPVLITGLVDDGSIYLPADFRSLPAPAFSVFCQKFTEGLEAEIIKAYAPAPSDTTIQLAANRLITDVLFYHPSQRLQHRYLNDGCQCAYVEWGAGNSAHTYFGELAGSEYNGIVRPGTKGLGAFNFTDVLLLFSPTVNTGDKFNLPDSASVEIREFYMAFINDGFNSQSVLETVRMEPDLSSDRSSKWLAYEKMPINWKQSGISLF